MLGDTVYTHDQVLRVGSVDFYCAAFATGRKPAGCLPVLKHPDNVERYVELSAQIRPKIVVELGIARGGSTALLNELFSPELLVALEISPDPVRVLSQYIDDHGVSSVVHPHYGVDQSDRATVARIVGDEIGDRPIDLVIDDASHQYTETRASFETLFPLVRPGGLFIIEDWNVDQLMGDAIDQARHDPSSPHHAAIVANDANGSAPRVAPLTQLAVELILIRGSIGDAVREVTINENWVVIERGDDPLDPHAFRLAHHVRDHHFGLRLAIE